VQGCPTTYWRLGQTLCYELTHEDWRSCWNRNAKGDDRVRPDDRLSIGWTGGGRGDGDRAVVVRCDKGQKRIDVDGDEEMMAVFLRQ
jgi:hypothetical protein